MNRKKLIIIISAILLLAAIVAGLIYFEVVNVRELLANINPEWGKEEVKEYQVPIPGNIITNVKNSRKVVRCEIVLILSDEEEAKRLEAETFKVKDVMLEILRSTEELEYRSDEIQQNLSARLVSKMKEMHDIQSITKVYYKQLITQ